MAGNSNGWNSFMQSKQTQVIMYGICVFFCVFYAVDGIMEMLSPERSALMMSNIGEGGYYALAITRTVVLLVTAGAFGRIVLKTLREKDE